MKLAVGLCVDLIGGKVSGESLRGAAEMRELALSALAALARADLGDVARTVHERVFGCNVNTLLEPYEENSIVRWRFKPMPELLLRELKELASAEHIPITERRRRIEWTFDMAGF
jgi:hypothetical protein